MQRELRLTSVPKRIISLVPSITELLHDLGLQEEVIGITKFCIHPKGWCGTKTKIGGTKNVKHEVIKDLQPDLIIGNKEENTIEDISELEKHYNVLMTDVNSFQDALEMIQLIGKTCERQEQSSLLNEQLIGLKKQSNLGSITTAIYLIWKDPYFAVGKDTFINDMMHHAGLENLIKTARYPEITIDKINDLSPELLLLSTEPYPFGNKHLKETQNHLLTTKTMLVDGEMFSWYGSRLLKSFAYFEQLKSELESK